MSIKNAYDNKSYADIQVLSEIDTTEPITAEEAKNYLRLDWDDDDETLELALLNTQITNARKQAERFISSDILSRSRRVIYDYLNEDINLYYGPIDTTETIEVYIDGVLQVAEQGYELIGLENPILRLLNGPAEKVRIDYTTKGIEATDEIKFGILAILWGLYFGRDGNMKGNYKHLLYPFKNFGYYGIK